MKSIFFQETYPTQNVSAKTIPQTGQNRYPIFHQNGWKTLPFGAAHTSIAYVKEYPCRTKLIFAILISLLSPRHYWVSVKTGGKSFEKGTAAC